MKDALQLFFLAGPISVFFPFYTTPVLLAGVVESYVAEEWLHYALQFSKSRVPLIRRMKKYHLYHCRLKGIDRGYDITALRHRSSEYREHAAKRACNSRYSSSMDALQHHLASWSALPRIEAPDPKILLGPVADGPVAGISSRFIGPTPGVGQPLRMRQICFTAPQSFLAPPSVLDVGPCAVGGELLFRHSQAM